MRYSKKGITLFIMELLFLAVFWIFMLIKVIRIDYKLLTVNFSNEGFDYFILATLAILVGIFHYLLNKKYPKEAKLRKELTSLYKEKATEKVRAAKQDIRIIAMVVIEFSVMIVVAIGIYGIFEKVKIFSENIPAIYRKVLIVLALIVFVYGYWRFMKPFYEYKGYYYVKRRKKGKGR